MIQRVVGAEPRLKLEAENARRPFRAHFSAVGTVIACSVRFRGALFFHDGKTPRNLPPRLGVVQLFSRSCLSATSPS